MMILMNPLDDVHGEDQDAGEVTRLWSDELLWLCCRQAGPCGDYGDAMADEDDDWSYGGGHNSLSHLNRTITGPIRWMNS